MPGVSDPVKYTYAPFFSPADDTLWLTSDRTPASLADLYRAQHLPDGGFATPVRALDLSSDFEEYHVVISSNGLRAYWGSKRSDGGAKGGHDIWTATRSSTTASFGAPVNVQELNTADGEYPNSLSIDGCRLYLTKYGAGPGRLHVAEKPTN